MNATSKVIAFIPFMFFAAIFAIVASIIGGTVWDFLMKHHQENTFYAIKGIALFVGLVFLLAIAVAIKKKKAEEDSE